MAYLHKLECWRHPETKERAIIAHIFGTRQSVSVDKYPYRSRIGQHWRDFHNATDAREALKTAGFEHKGV